MGKRKVDSDNYLSETAKVLEFKGNDIEHDIRALEITIQLFRRLTLEPKPIEERAKILAEFLKDTSDRLQPFPSETYRSLENVLMEISTAVWQSEKK